MTAIVTLSSLLPSSPRRVTTGTSQNDEATYVTPSGVSDPVMAGLTDSDRVGYCYVYFASPDGNVEDDQKIYFAFSRDGLHWTGPIRSMTMQSTISERAVRDPFIMRRSDRDGFVLIGTDLDFNSPSYATANGGIDFGATVRRGSTGICVWESPDLVHWSNERVVDVASAVNAGNAWAPRAIWDGSRSEYLVYWSSCTPGDDYRKQRIWAAWTRDFTAFGTPFMLIEREHSVIDAALSVHDGRMVMYIKNEDGKYVYVETSDDLLGPYARLSQSTLERFPGGFEGPTSCVLPDGRTLMMVDEYLPKWVGYRPFISDDSLSEDSFRPLNSDEFSLPAGANHGSIIALTAREWDTVSSFAGL